jgi:protein TonB
MFEQTFVNVNAQTRKPWTIAGSLIIQVVGICALLIAPLLHIAAIRPVLQGPITVRLVKTEPPPPPFATHTPVARIHRILSGILTAPRTVPPSIDLTPDPPDAMSEVSGVPFGPAGVLSALPTIGTAPPPAPNLEPTPKPPAAPLKVSSGVQAARLIFAPRPAYPMLAKTARVEGSVRLHALIGRDGTVENVQLTSGPPLLVSAAMEAIRQWRYQPTILNGETVPVETDIIVTFTLRQ